MKKIAIAAIAIWEMICLFLMAIARSTHDSVGIFVFLALAPFIAALIHKATDKPKQTKYGNNSIETKPEIPDNIEQDLQLSKEDGCTYIKKQLSQMKADGIEKYEFLATLDTETCPVCGALDKKIFSVSQAKIGVNCPPMHDGCRCVIIEYFDDEFSSGSTRAARDPKTGKTIYVPDISYTEWKKYTDNN